MAIAQIKPGWTDRPKPRKVEELIPRVKLRSPYPRNSCVAVAAGLAAQWSGGAVTIQAAIKQARQMGWNEARGMTGLEAETLMQGLGATIKPMPLREGRVYLDDILVAAASGWGVVVAYTHESRPHGHAVFVHSEKGALVVRNAIEGRKSPIRRLAEATQGAKEAIVWLVGPQRQGEPA